METDLNKYKMDPSRGLPMDSGSTAVHYDRDGLITVNKERSVAYTLTNQGTGRVSYFIMTHASGYKAQRLFDPREDEFVYKATKNGLERYTFRSVPESAFNHYLRYLRNGSVNHLRIAERGDH